MASGTSSDLPTQLRNAVMYGNVELVKSLLAQGVDVNGRCGAAKGVLNTYLHTACSRGHEAVVKILVEHGAKLETKNSDGETPIFIAVKERFPNLVELLIRKI
jgi:ankyrin repeat protein